MPTNT